MSESEELEAAGLAVTWMSDGDDPEDECSFKDKKVAPWVTTVDKPCPHSPYPVCIEHADYMKSKIGRLGFCAECGEGQVVTGVRRK